MLSRCSTTLTATLRPARGCRACASASARGLLVPTGRRGEVRHASTYASGGSRNGSERGSERGGRAAGPWVAGGIVSRRSRVVEGRQGSKEDSGGQRKSGRWNGMMEKEVWCLPGDKSEDQETYGHQGGASSRSGEEKEERETLNAEAWCNPQGQASPSTTHHSPSLSSELTTSRLSLPSPTPRACSTTSS